MTSCALLSHIEKRILAAIENLKKADELMLDVTPVPVTEKLKKCQLLPSSQKPLVLDSINTMHVCQLQDLGEGGGGTLCCFFN